MKTIQCYNYSGGSQETYRFVLQRDPWTISGLPIANQGSRSLFNKSVSWSHNCNWAYQQLINHGYFQQTGYIAIYVLGGGGGCKAFFKWILFPVYTRSISWVVLLGLFFASVSFVGNTLIAIVFQGEEDPMAWKKAKPSTNDINSYGSGTDNCDWPVHWLNGPQLVLRTDRNQANKGPRASIDDRYVNNWVSQDRN